MRGDTSPLLHLQLHKSSIHVLSESHIISGLLLCLPKKNVIQRPKNTIGLTAVFVIVPLPVIPT